MFEKRYITPEIKHHYPPKKELKKFLKPPKLWGWKNGISLRNGDEQTPKPGVALVIGRFQPLHWGHMHLINEALKIHESLIIGIGSSNVISEDNPFTAIQRHEMLNEALSESGLRSRVKIVHLLDHDDDDKWLEKTYNSLGNIKVDTVVGNNPWVNDIFKADGVPTVEVKMVERDKTSGSYFRNVLTRKGYLRHIPRTAELLSLNVV